MFIKILCLVADANNQSGHHNLRQRLANAKSVSLNKTSEAAVNAMSVEVLSNRSHSVIQIVYIGERSVLFRKGLALS